MTDSRAALTSAPGDVARLARDLAWDLATASGLLSEITTCWRRAQTSMREFPAGRPLRLQDAGRQIEADIRSLAEGNLDRRADLALSVAGRFTMLSADVAAARSVTQVPGMPATGDAALWNSAADVLGRARTRLLSLVLAVAAITSWSMNRTPSAGAAKPWILVELGELSARVFRVRRPPNRRRERGR